MFSVKSYTKIGAVVAEYDSFFLFIFFLSNLFPLEQREEEEDDEKKTHKEYLILYDDVDRADC